MKITFPAYKDTRPIIEMARAEDLGGDDVTSRLMIERKSVGVCTIVQKEKGIVCGLPIVEMVAKVYDPKLRVKFIGNNEGQYNTAKRTPLMQICGPMRSLLSAERVILNFLQHLSGVATLTHQFVQQVKGTEAKIYDTRKTIPGLRLLEKYAVRCGGGFNHRIGLYDGLLVKDNHMADIPIAKLADFVAEVVSRSRKEAPKRFVEVEVDRLEQLREVLKVTGIDCILLDNMDCAQMRQAVKMRNQAGIKGKVSLEASGGVTLKTVRRIAQTGVDRISIGALTHSAPALDIGLDIE